MIAAPLCDDHILNTHLRELQEQKKVSSTYSEEPQPCAFCRNPTHFILDVAYLPKNVLSVDSKA
jgi:hypothetical protein